jgi:hypothetical protein
MENIYMKRNTKISCDVSREADNMLKAYCAKHERSKGFLLEKMIRKFCGGDIEPVAATEVIVVEKPKPKAKRKVFKPPTVEEVREYCDSRCNDVNPQKFISHYTANGWVRGKAETKIKCWKSCVQTWEGNNKTPVKSNESLQGDW